MLFKDIAVLNEDFSVSHGMDVRVEGSRIAAVGGASQGGRSYGGQPGALDLGASRPDSAPVERVFDGRGKLLMPGFYNSHTHSSMTLLRGYGENLPLREWLTKKIFPLEERLTGEDCYHGTMLAMAESFSHGIVSSSDNYFFCEDIVRAAVESGAKMNASRGLSFFDDLLDLAGFTPYHESRKLFNDHHGAADGRIRVDIGMHAEYTATPALIEAVAALSHETGAGVHVHVSETRSEHEECKAKNGGRTPTQVLADAGVFDNGGLAAHCVWIEECDADILKEKGVTAVTCPASNMKLASGMARVPLLIEKGVNVALGTDGAASNNSLNFLDDMKLMSLSAKVRLNDPTALTPEEALYIATRGGALAQGRADCGYIKEGYRADLVVLDLSSPSLNPVYNMANALVFAVSSRDIVMTMVDGKVVYERGAFPTLDIERTLHEVERSRVRILGELGEPVELGASNK
ncbi:MAG: amidohydrolase [Clostridiales bacterium]|nr:amidohydrolase [Clostridiales bacterium]